MGKIFLMLSLFVFSSCGNRDLADRDDRHDDHHDDHHRHDRDDDDRDDHRHWWSS